MKIFITGGTGFVGREILAHPLARAHRFTALARSPRPLEGVPADALRFVEGDLLSPGALHPGMEGCEAVIHLVGVIKEVGRQSFERVHVEGTRGVVEAARRAGVRRFLHMSAENTRPDAPDRYHTTKWAAEEIVRASGLDFTIFRPSMMFGRHDRNFNELARIIRRAPVVPVIGDGNYVWRPVWVGDVARIFLAALEKPESTGRTYEIRGPERFTFNEILDLLMEILGTRRPRVFAPPALMRPVVALMGLAPSLAPITPEQVKMLLDETEPPPENFSTDFPGPLKRLEEGLREYLP